MNVLVVGGAGYIGSHCVRQLQAAGHRPVVLDNLIFGHRQAVHAAVPFYECDLGDRQAVGQILRDEQIELVMHFAAFAFVGESVEEPLKYYENNVVATLRLLESMLENGVKQFVFLRPAQRLASRMCCRSLKPLRKHRSTRMGRASWTWKIF